MHILRIYPFLPPLPGGMEKHILRLSEEQRLLGCTVSLVFNQGQATTPDDIRILPALNMRNLAPRALRDLLFYAGVAAAVVRRRVRPDVLHIHGDWSAMLCGRLIGWLTGARVKVASFHGQTRKGAWRHVYRAVLAGYEMTYTTGAAETSYLEACGLRAVYWQNSGIESQFFEDGAQHGAAEVDVLVVGNFLPVKNYPLVVDIARAMPDVSFLLIGDGPQRAQIEQTCQAGGLRNVRFSGALPSPEVCARMRGARLLLSTSLSEGTPTSLLEAMAVGLAVVTSRSNNYDKLIKPGCNGYIVDGFDSADYVAKLRILLDDTALLREVALRNRREARTHSWPEVARKITQWMEAA